VNVLHVFSTNISAHIGLVQCFYDLGLTLLHLHVPTCTIQLKEPVSGLGEAIDRGDTPNLTW
jgi:hypothetical protein